MTITDTDRAALAQQFAGYNATGQQDGRAAIEPMAEPTEEYRIQLGTPLDSSEPSPYTLRANLTDEQYQALLYALDTGDRLTFTLPADEDAEYYAVQRTERTIALSAIVAVERTVAQPARFCDPELRRQAEEVPF